MGLVILLQIICLYTEYYYLKSNNIEEFLKLNMIFV